MIDVLKLLNSLSFGSFVSHRGFKIGDVVQNTNQNCMHYGTVGIIKDIEKLKEDAGFLVVYKVDEDKVHNGKFVGLTLKKTEDQISLKS